MENNVIVSWNEIFPRMSNINRRQTCPRPLLNISGGVQQPIIIDFKAQFMRKVRPVPQVFLFQKQRKCLRLRSVQVFQSNIVRVISGGTSEKFSHIPFKADSVTLINIVFYSDRSGSCRNRFSPIRKRGSHSNAFRHTGKRTAKSQPVAYILRIGIDVLRSGNDLVHFITVTIASVKKDVIACVKRAVIFAGNINRDFFELRSGEVYGIRLDCTAGCKQSERARVNIIKRQHAELSRRNFIYSVRIRFQFNPIIGKSKIGKINCLSIGRLPLGSFSRIDSLFCYKRTQFIFR